MMSERTPERLTGGGGGPRLTRRDVLRVSGGIGAAGLAAGGWRVAGAQTGGATPPPIEIPDSGAQLPSEEVTLTWTESSQFSRAVMPAFFETYQAKHPNIAVQYDNLPDVELARVLQLSFQSGNMPDAFRLLPEIIPSAQAVSEGLVQPLDGLVPNFAAWKAAFPPGSFTEGINVFNGQTYTFPMLGNFTQTLQFNRDYLRRAGLDPVAQPFTFETFRAAAKQLTEQGQGAYYGLIIGGADIARWSSFVVNLGQLAGAPGGEFNYLTGTYNYASDGFLAAIDLLLALRSDGSISPNSISINSDQARATMPQGQSAMIVNETGIVPFWKAESPDFDFGIAPLPAGAAPAAIAAPPPGGFWWVSANSERGAVIGDIFAFLGSTAGQITWQQVGGASLPVIFPQANEVEGIDPRLQEAYTYFQRVMRIRPEPVARNPAVSQVLQRQRAVTPNLGTVVQGIFTGQVDDPRRAMEDLQSRTEEELDRAIADAQSSGAQVSRDDYVFPNWDPSQDYTQANYDALTA